MRGFKKPKPFILMEPAEKKSNKLPEMEESIVNGTYQINCGEI